MTIEGLGKKFQEARVARKLTLDEAARMTKIRPSRLAELEADDFSQFPSLAYAKGFLLIYGKFLEVDVTPYLEAFEGSENVTVDGYSYLQESPAPKPKRTPIIRAAKKQASVWPLLVAVAVFVVGFSVMKLVMNLKRLEPNRDTLVGIPQPSAPSPSAVPSAPAVAVVFADACETAAALGADVVEVSLPDAVATLATFVTTQRAEAVCGHRARGLYPNRASEYGSDVRSRLEAADGVHLADYIDAQAMRQRIRAEWARLFCELDVVLTPVSAKPAPLVRNSRKWPILWKPRLTGLDA